jgi:nanoRNase/pAp phosphatase (c-di-AMP/oligoRNAs hydrolase)
VDERVALYRQQSALFGAQLQRSTAIIGDVAVVDLRQEDPIYAGNRFMVYALYPESSVSVHVLWGRQKQNTVLAVGKSILNRSNHVDIGALMLQFGGGGHRNAGTCQVAHEDAERDLGEIVRALNFGRVASLS